MRFNINSVVILSVFFLVITGCSKGGNTPVQPVVYPESSPIIESGDVFDATGIMGVYELTLDPESVSAELNPVRSGAIGEGFIVSGAGFFTMSPCPNCLRLIKTGMSPEGSMKLTFSVDHPFPKGDTGKPPTAMNRLDLDVFDTALVIVPESADKLTFSKTGVQMYHNAFAKADGYTSELSEITNDTNPCPYFLVIDDSETGSFTYNRLEMGTKLNEFDTYFTGEYVRFNLYMTMGYGASAIKQTRLEPTYYNPEFNRKAAWKVEVIPPQGNEPPTAENTWTYHDTTMPRTLTVKVWDWQHNSTVSSSYPDPNQTTHISSSSYVADVSIEIPGMTNSLVTSSTPVSGSGTPNQPLIFRIPIVNENNLPGGDYVSLVRVTDSRTPSGTPANADSLVHTPDGIILDWYTMDKYATYQLFTATVVETEGVFLTNPDGGEFWEMGQPAVVEWFSAGTTTSIDIDLSLDSGATYSIPIASAAPNTGAFDIPTVGSWQTEHARIRIIDHDNPTFFDESSSDFRISCAVPDTPTGLTASDGTHSTHVALSWNSVTDADSYNVYRDSVRIQTGIIGTSWNDSTVTRGRIYTYQVVSVNICGESAVKSDPDDGYASGCAGGDGNNSCLYADKLELFDSISGCVDQIDTDWYFVYLSPGGVASSSSFDLNITTGTVDAYVYGRDPGQTCPGTLLTSELNTGSTTINVPTNFRSCIYIKLTGNSGMVNYTLMTDFVPDTSYCNVEVYVATDNGTSGGTWPMRGSTELTHSTIVQMMTYANNFWEQYGYNLKWDNTETFMAAQYYNLNDDAEVMQMHNTYGKNSGKLALYFVNQLQPGMNTAYCVTINPISQHKDDNVFTVYSPNVWTWQAVIAHEHGHALGYYQDQYLYNECSCSCGNDSCLSSCLGFTQYLKSDPLGCYNGNLMHYDLGWTWDQYDLTAFQENWINEFHFLLPNNFNWN